MNGTTGPSEITDSLQLYLKTCFVKFSLSSSDLNSEYASKFIVEVINTIVIRDAWWCQGNGWEHPFLEVRYTSYGRDVTLLERTWEKKENVEKQKGQGVWQCVIPEIQVQSHNPEIL